MSPVEEQARVCMWFYMLVFSFATLASLLCAWRVFYITKPGWTITKVVHILIPVCLFARTLDFVLNYSSTGYHMFIRATVAQGVWATVLASLPVYLFFTTYILVCLSWYYIFHQSFQRSPALLRRIFLAYIAINAFVYSAWALLILFISKHHTSRVAHKIETFFAITISVGAGVAFGYFGRQLYSRMRNLPVISSSKLAISKKVGMTAALCTFTFIFRAIIIFVSYYYLRSQSQMLVDNIIWFTVIELVPSVAVLVLTGDVRRSLPLNHINHINPSRSNGEIHPFLKQHSHS